MPKLEAYRSRPRNYDTAVAAMVPQNIADWLKEQAEVRGTTVSAVVREILADFVMSENPLT
jgi:hypothetical protein